MRTRIFYGCIMLWMACTPTPKEIQYGMDACQFCKMTIMDNQHASQIVTAKGKVYLFDSIECMAGYQQASTEEYAFVLVSDYAQPGSLIAAETGTFLISDALPSPMGANLSAFSDPAEAEKLKDQHGGEVYTWTQVSEKINPTHH